MQALDAGRSFPAAATAMDTELLDARRCTSPLHCSGRLRSRLPNSRGGEEARVTEQVELYGVFLPSLAAHALFALQACAFSHRFSARSHSTVWFGTAHCLTLRCTLPLSADFLPLSTGFNDMKNLTLTTGQVLQLSMTACAAILGWHLWSFYMEAPWTRDAHVRADIIRLAPDVSGPVAEVLISDNAQVEKERRCFALNGSLRSRAARGRSEGNG